MVAHVFLVLGASMLFAASFAGNSLGSRSTEVSGKIVRGFGQSSDAVPQKVVLQNTPATPKLQNVLNKHNELPQKPVKKLDFKTREMLKVFDRYKDTIIEVSDIMDVDPKVVLSVIMAESRGKHNAVSPTGALGCMQTLRSTDRYMGFGKLDSFNCELSIIKGTAYLGILRDRYGYTNQDWAIVAYNKGPGAAKSDTLESIKRNEYLRVVKMYMNLIPPGLFEPST